MSRITHVRLPEPLSNSQDSLWWLDVDDQDIILSVNSMEESSAISGEHWGMDWLSPMGMDLQINGGLGLAFPELTFESLSRLFDLLDLLWLDGVEAICPTFVSCDFSDLHRGLEVLREARKHNSHKRCKLLGAHLEGPFLEKDYRGAHSLDHLCSPNLSLLSQLIDGFEDEIDLFTLAPELEGSLDVIKMLKKKEIVVCLGHSSADEEESRRAFDNGVSMITHAFNAMRGLHHRSPGPVGEAIKSRTIAIGLIADGIHVHPTIAVLLQKLASRKLVLVSDAISPYGLKDGLYKWDKRVVCSAKGSCRLEDGTLAGSIVSQLKSCQNLARWSREPSASIWAATVSPRLVLERKFKLDEYFVGQSLKKLLRWTINTEDNELSWHQAA